MSNQPVTFDQDGLIPVVIQDDQTGAVLMLAYMNAEALAKTRSTGNTHFWSRSRQKLWRKGETSGHEQMVKSIHISCYQNSLLIRVDQIGAACHTGFPTCFYRQLTADNDLVETESRRFDPEQVYGSPGQNHVSLWVGSYRWLADHDVVAASGTSRLLRESSVPVLSARVADELRELAAVLTGDHQHHGPTEDVLLEGSQILYWIVLTSIRAGLLDDQIVEAIQPGLDVQSESEIEDLPPHLRGLADDWQRAFFRDLPDQFTRTVTAVAQAARAAKTNLGTMLERDLQDLRSRPYLSEYFASTDT
jgi:phosphoribosyl-AMP cyclohydrolase